MASDLDAVSNNFFGCFSECLLGVTLRLALCFFLWISEASKHAFFDLSPVPSLRSKLSSSFLKFRGFESGRKLPFFELSRVLRLRRLSSSFLDF